MAPHLFARLLEAELLLRRARFSLADLREFVAEAWPLIGGDPDVQGWAREFLEARAAALDGGDAGTLPAVPVVPPLTAAPAGPGPSATYGPCADRLRFVPWTHPLAARRRPS
jgi:hypothetical protein